MSSPDYENVNMDAVLSDFLLRIEHYRERYEPLDETKEAGLSFMKIYNTGEKVVVHKHEGHIQSRIVYYLMNIHIVPRTIYLTRVSPNFDNCKMLFQVKLKLFNSLCKHRKTISIFFNPL